MLQLKDIKKYYKVGETTTKALDGVSVAFRKKNSLLSWDQVAQVKRRC